MLIFDRSREEIIYEILSPVKYIHGCIRLFPSFDIHVLPFAIVSAGSHIILVDLKKFKAFDIDYIEVKWLNPKMREIWKEDGKIMMC